jgi:AraC family ethanolamine operon transcriptional activator
VPFSLDTSILLHRRFDDFDDLAFATRHWDLDLMQLDRGEFEGEIMQITSSDILFSEARFGRTLTQHGSAPLGVRTFAVPAAPDVRFKWRGREVGPNDLLIFPHSGELYAISGPDFHVFTISLPESVLERVAELTDAGGLQAMLRREVLTCPPSVASPLRYRLHAISRLAKSGITRPTDAARLNGLQSVIPRLLVRAMNSARSIDSIGSTPRRTQVIERAKEFLMESQRRPLAVRDVCEAIGVSERTLQYAFLGHFGVSPKSYLRAVRLANVRRELKRSRPGGVRISDVAACWGFWHMGQFAADYRKQFGELPSKTLAKSNMVGCSDAEGTHGKK